MERSAWPSKDSPRGEKVGNRWRLSLFVLLSVLLLITIRNTVRLSHTRAERQEVVMVASIKALLVIALVVESVL